MAGIEIVSEFYSSSVNDPNANWTNDANAAVDDNNFAWRDILKNTGAGEAPDKRFEATGWTLKSGKNWDGIITKVEIGIRYSTEAKCGGGIVVKWKDASESGNSGNILIASVVNQTVYEDITSYANAPTWVENWSELHDLDVNFVGGNGSLFVVRQISLYVFYLRITYIPTGIRKQLQPIF